MDNFIITSLVLVNYKRMSSGSFKRFTFRPNSDYPLQKILGTNGCGKSSLLWELWPLAANENDYGVNGRKELCGDYKGHSYQLISDFSGPKPKHEFWVDGEDLNDGGKIGMFQALAFEHFGVSPELRALALEDDKLTVMSPSRRRYWMVKLADTDFNYAIKAYNQLKDAHRDAQGAIRRLQKRLVDEKLKLFGNDVAEQINKDVAELKTLIREVYDMRNADVAKPELLMGKLTDNDEMLKSFSNEIDRMGVELLSATGYENREELDQRREIVKLEIHSCQQLTQHLYTDHNRIKKKYDVLIQAGTESISELETKKATSEELIVYEEAFIAMRNVAIDHDPQALKEAFAHVYQDLYEKITQLPKNDGVFTRVKAQECEQRVSALIAQIRPLAARMSRLEGDIEHRRDHIQHDAVVCPACKHSWTIKASEGDLKKAEEALVQMKKTMFDIETEVHTLEKYLAEFTEYSAAYRLVMTTMKANPILANFFNEICQNNRLMLYPGSVAADMATVSSDLEHHVEIQKHKTIIKTISEQIELKKNLDADTLENIEAEMRRLEETLAIQTKNLNRLNEELRQVESYIRTDDRVKTLHENMKMGADVAKESVRLYVYSRYQELLTEIVFSLQQQIARKEDVLASIVAQEQIVADVESQLSQAIMNEKVAKMAHVALSPTSGAIAEGLHRSTNSFVTKMNKIINAVWNYPLEIQPFKMDDGQVDMDYKFPFMKNRDGDPIEDVVDGSESMKKIFNFAFRVCALQQLGMGHLALFLDEFEAPFDDVHRERAVYFIKKLMDEEAYGQIFMVSHFESLHGALTSQSQTCVVSRDNLLLPDDIVVNEHVSFA